MTPPHYVFDDFLHYLDHDLDAPTARALEAHLATCQACQALYSQARTIIGTLSDPTMWPPEPEPDIWPAPSARAEQSLEDVLRFRERLDVEESAGAAALRPLLTRPPEEWPSIVASTPALHSGGAISPFLAEARVLLNAAPGRALALLDQARVVAAALRDDAYPARTTFMYRGYVARDRATTLTVLGRFPEAFEALSQAEAAMRQAAVPWHELAILDHVRANVLTAAGRPAEALGPIRRAIHTLGEFGDLIGATKAQVLEAVVLYDLGDLVRARDAFEACLAPLKDLGDLNTLARTYSNLGFCHLDLGDPDRAGAAYLQAMALYTELGLLTERVKIRWGLGRMLLQTGRSAEGLPVLRQALMEFDGFGMTAEAGLVTLEIVEALLALGQPAEAPALCQAVLDRFLAAGMTANALAALAYLKEAVAAGRATPTLARQVHLFLEALPTHPDQAFLPPPLST